MATEHRTTRLYAARLYRWARSNPIDIAYLGGLLAIGCYIYLFKLGSYPVRSWDEAIYADVARNMVQNGHWIVPHASFLGDFGPFLEKTPLIYWLQAFSMYVFGINEFAVRFPSALAMILSGVVVYVVGRDVADRRTGFLAGVILLTTPAFWAGFNGGRAGGTDTMLLLFGSLFVLCTWLVVDRDDPRYSIPMGIAAGLAVLTKGVAAGTFVVAVLPLVVLYHQRFVNRTMALGVGITTLLVAPWPIAMLALHPEMFIEDFWIDQVVNRAAGEHSTGGESPDTVFGFMNYPYLTKLIDNPWTFHPWLFFTPSAVAVALWNGIRKWNAGSRRPLIARLFLIWWAAVVLLVYLPTGNRPWYLIPMYLPLAALIGNLIVKAVDGQLLAIAGTVLGVIGTVTISTWFGLGSEQSYEMIAGLIGVIAYLFLMPLLSHRLSNRQATLVPAVVFLLAAICVVGVVVGTPPVLNQWDPPNDQKEMGEYLESESAPDETVYVANLGRPPHPLAFYSGRALEDVTIDEINGNHDVQFAVVRESALDDLNRDYTVVMKGKNTESGSLTDFHTIVLIEFE